MSLRKLGEDPLHLVFTDYGTDRLVVFTDAPQGVLATMSLVLYLGGPAGRNSTSDRRAIRE